MRAARIGLVLAVVGAASATAWTADQWYRPYRGYRGEAVVVRIPHGLSTHHIARLLAAAGVVRNAWSFELLCRLKGGRLEAGEYRFEQALSPVAVYDQLAQGRIWVVTLTIPEGWTSLDIAAALARAGLARAGEFLQVVQNPAPVRDLAPSAPSLEGFLFPDTYQFPHQTTPEQIAQAMIRRFRQQWQQLTAPEGAPRDALPVVTLASLVEAETAREAERPVVAGVFVNRLRLGLPLDCDPTVIYALRQRGTYQGTLDDAALHVASPYNTYLHRGLPPGPINNPGRSALLAALHPATVPYLYFVSDGSGGHRFSRTLAEHSRNVLRYRQHQTARKGAS